MAEPTLIETGVGWVKVHHSGDAQASEVIAATIRAAFDRGVKPDRLEHVRSVIRSLPLAEAQPEFEVSALVARLHDMERKEVYNSLTYLAGLGELKRVGYGRYLITDLRIPLAAFERHSLPVWMDIDTAPKDTEIVLAWSVVDSSGRPVWYQTIGRWEAQFEGTGYGEKLGDTIWRGAWTDYTVASWNYEEYAELHPTHWAPLLPSPPQQEPKP